MKLPYTITPKETVAHLSAKNWEAVNRIHLCKIFTEFIHEGILEPEQVYDKNKKLSYKLNVPRKSNTYYLFEARVLPLHHFLIDQKSVRKIENEKESTIDSIKFFIEFKSQIGISDAILPEYMEELISTLHGMASIYGTSNATIKELASANYQTIEGSMLGHPRFIANNGRVGFDAEDYSKYAPEAAHPISLVWLAGHKSVAVYSAIDGLPYSKLIKEELDKQDLDKFNLCLIDKEVAPEDYYFFPVHPWQWKNKIAQIFIGDLATNKLIFLGDSLDHYLPQQSIRTFFNIDFPEKRYVKTALSILNMGYIRGLSQKFMKTNPLINEWLCFLLKDDKYLQQLGFVILKEVAGISFKNHSFEKVSSEDSSYQKMLACLWREGPCDTLQDGESLMTMAALLHIDFNGESLLIELIKKSGLSTQEWIESYLRSYMKPLLHCFYELDLVFMPHGENVILIMKNDVPVRIIMKDTGEEISLLNWSKPVPEEVKRLKVTVSDINRTLPIFTQLIDSIFRFISVILDDSGTMLASDFWAIVAGIILEYQNENSHLSEKFDKYSLFVDKFQSDALNRMQLRNNRQLRDRSNPFSGKENVGHFLNPLVINKTDKM